MITCVMFLYIAIIIMPRCACASEVYGSVCVCVLIGIYKMYRVDDGFQTYILSYSTRNVQL